jgi:hypothetical protein
MSISCVIADAFTRRRPLLATRRVNRNPAAASRGTRDALGEIEAGADAVAEFSVRDVAGVLLHANFHERCLHASARGGLCAISTANGAMSPANSC